MRFIWSVPGRCILHYCHWPPQGLLWTTFEGTAGLTQLLLVATALTWESPRSLAMRLLLKTWANIWCGWICGNLPILNVTSELRSKTLVKLYVIFILRNLQPLSCCNIHLVFFDKANKWWWNLLIIVNI